MTTTQTLADPQRDGTLYVRDLTATPLPATRDGHRVRPATVSDSAALQEAMEASGMYTHDVVATRLANGRLAHIVETRGSIVSYGWIALTAEPIGDLGISFRLDPGEAYIYDCATRPAHRGHGLYPLLLRGMLASLHEHGLRRVWIATAPGNLVSQRGIDRAGFQKVADVRITRQAGNAVEVELFGVPGVHDETLRHAAWSFHGTPRPGTGRR